jgi:hypothetical protein
MQKTNPNLTHAHTRAHTQTLTVSMANKQTFVDYLIVFFIYVATVTWSSVTIL